MLFTSSRWTRIETLLGYGLPVATALRNGTAIALLSPTRSFLWLSPTGGPQALMDLGSSFALEEAVALVKKYAWLAEFRIVDFYTVQYWDFYENIPEPWRCFARSLPNKGYLGHLLDLTVLNPEERTEPTPPQEVTQFVLACQKCSFQGRGPTSVPVKIPSVQRTKIKEKKGYELQMLTEILDELMSESHLGAAVDVGAGQGLQAMELLERREECIVYAVESADIQVHGTLSRLEDRALLKQSSRLIIRQTYLKADLPMPVFEESLFGVDLVAPYLMYSLHACGSLSESMLQLFAHPSGKAQVLCNVACCYNLIEPSLPGRHFPLSARVTTLWEGTILTRNMKMVACQAPSRWSLRPKNTHNFLRRHHFRSLLELLVRDQMPAGLAESSTSRVGNISDASLMSFEVYVTAAFRNMGLADHLPSPETIERLERRWEAYEKTIAFMWTMRALLGPVIEALILVDRYHYLREALSPTSIVSLRAIFDPLRSPRNMALIAVKK